MGQQQGKFEKKPPIVDIEHSSLENESSSEIIHPKLKVRPRDTIDQKSKASSEEESTNPDKKKSEKIKSRPLPILKPYISADAKSSASKPTAPASASPPPAAPGPTRVKRLFRRHSSMRVCPDAAVAPGNRSPGASSAAGDPAATPPVTPSTSSTPVSPSAGGDSPGGASRGGTTPAFLFSGLLTPAPLPSRPEAEDGFITVPQLYNSMNDGQLCPYMFDPTYLLMIDTRGLQDYKRKHIVTAKHLTDLADPLKVEPLELYTMLILYDHKGLSHSLPDSCLTIALKNLQLQGLEPFVLVGGFDAFHAKFPFLCTARIPASETERQRLIVPYPSVVLDDTLYLGRGDQATSRTIMTNLGITHIVNVTRDRKHAFPTRLKYHQIEVDDDAAANLLDEFPVAVKFITDAVNSSKGKVMVHCNLGVSRSSTVVLAYLMYTRRWSLRDARLYLKERRPISHPNNAFMAQLSRFEEMLFGKRLTNLHQLH